MSRIRVIVLALLVSMFAFFAGCDDDQTEEDSQAGEEVECVVSEEETCEVEEVEAGEVAADMDAPEEDLPVEEEVDMEIPVEEEEAGEEEETTEEAPEAESEEEEAPESEDPEDSDGE